MTWNEYGYIIASNYRLKVVRSLLIHPKTPKQISVETKIGLTHVSRTLKELATREMVQCINPQEVKGRVYTLTDKGKKVAKLTEKDNSIDNRSESFSS